MVTSFRPLSGNLLSLQYSQKGKRFYDDCFRPLSGNLLSLLSASKTSILIGDLVFVPYRGIYFLYKAKKIKSLEGIRFRPLSGNLLSLRNTRLSFTSVVICFRPLSGNLLSLPEMNYNTIILKRFRPLSGNLLSLPEFEEWVKVYQNSFSSPIGESTFSTDNKVVLKGKVLFSSPIGESTFSTNPECRNTVLQNAVFVPYRGIYFLYKRANEAAERKQIVFVPYRGIYFLYCKRNF